MDSEARLSDHKRVSLKSALALKFGGLLELAEKATIIGELGKLLIEEVPLETTPPGYGRGPYHGLSNPYLIEECRGADELLRFPSAQATRRLDGSPMKRPDASQKYTLHRLTSICFLPRRRPCLLLPKLRSFLPRALSTTSPARPTRRTTSSPIAPALPTLPDLTACMKTLQCYLSGSLGPIAPRLDLKTALLRSESTHPLSAPLPPIARATNSARVNHHLSLTMLLVDRLRPLTRVLLVWTPTATNFRPANTRLRRQKTLVLPCPVQASGNLRIDLHLARIG